MPVALPATLFDGRDSNKDCRATFIFNGEVRWEASWQDLHEILDGMRIEDADKELVREGLTVLQQAFGSKDTDKALVDLMLPCKQLQDIINFKASVCPDSSGCLSCVP